MSNITGETGNGHVRTRFLVISDTHSAVSLPAAESDLARPPPPKVDVLLHCGDLTMVGLMYEYERTLDLLNRFDADLKLIIAGNHDISLDEVYYRRKGPYMHRRGDYDENLPAKARDFWLSDRVKSAGVMFLDEGMHIFTLKNGANLRVYASPYQPEFCDWAFPYFRNEDRYNPSQQCTPNAVPIAENPIPDFPAVDVMMTHGPPMGILDTTSRGEHVGCQHLLRAARRCKPRLHCFGHIHEAWGAQRVKWNQSEELDSKIENHVEGSQEVEVSMEDFATSSAVRVDISNAGGEEVKHGEETLMVNASIMTLRYKPWNSPWLVDLDLERAA